MERLFFDGGMGTILHGRGLADDPVQLNVTHSRVITEIHRQYLDAGAQVLTANTFGAYTHKHANAADLVEAAIKNARAAGTAKVALDMGPLGVMLEPYGDMTPDEAQGLFAQTAQAGAKHGADMILIETFYCMIELEAAVTAAKATGLPVFATMTFDKRGRTTMGTPLSKMAEALEAWGVDVLGMNCGLGPDTYLELLPQLCGATRLPILVQPNAGLPEMVDGKTVYNVSPADFAGVMARIAQCGATHLGGCCGTTPAHIAAMIGACAAI
ncbi:MAG: homocysteine S-methyltransferase family protein [Defluviitaleaceae bacterium]|nr:homocysteine S-methyltransferase family protein [Defluviitaleaceae bacterium]